jgi:hypothetical protein
MSRARRGTKEVGSYCDCGSTVVRVETDDNGEIVWDDLITWGTCAECGEPVLVGRDEVEE